MLSKDLSFQYQRTRYQVIALNGKNRLMKQRRKILERLPGEVIVKRSCQQTKGTKVPSSPLGKAENWHLTCISNINLNPWSLMKNQSLVPLFALMALSLFSAAAHASLTPVNPSPGGDPSLLVPNGSTPSVMQTLFGAGNYTRVDDSGDNFWSSQGGTATVQAAFAGNNETLGLFNGGNSVTTGGAGFTTLFSVSGSGYSITGSGSVPVSNLFRFGLMTSPAQGTQYMSSNAANNTLDSAGFNDHMVTFLITAGASAGNYAIAFEDLLQNSDLGFSSDRDFNDAVFIVSHVAPLPAPEPSTYLLMGSLLGLVAFRKQISRLAKITVRS